MLYRIEAIVIRSMDYGEGNKIVTLLSRTHGKVGVMVRGAKKPRSRHGSLAQLLTHGDFIFYKKSGLGTLSNGEILASHHTLRERLPLSAFASYAAELVDRTVPDDEDTGYIFSQLKAGLEALEAEKDPQIVMHLLEMKVLEIAGYAPVVTGCCSCGREARRTRFSIMRGGLLCDSCSGQDAAALMLGEGTVKLLRLFRELDMRRLGSITVSTATKAELKQVMRHMLDHHLALVLKSRQVLEQLERTLP